MTKSQYELIIIGAGVVGMGAALAAHKKGIKKILVIDRHQACTGASIRNFGFITITGLRQKLMQKRALRSREIWLDLVKKAKITVNHRGLYLVAQHKESIPVLEEYLKVDPRKTVKLLSKKEMEAQSPLFKKNNNFGGLYSSDEVRIEPRLAIPAVAKYLQSIGIDFLWSEEVLDFSHQKIITQKRKIQFKKLIMAPGNHLKGLGRDVFEKKEVQSSKLHMLRVMPEKKIILPGGIMADLTLMRYPGYENPPSKKKLDKVIKKTCRAELDNGIHVIVVQGKDGSLTIGDSHHYTHDTHFPFENETVDNLILKKFDQVLPIGKYKVIERWVGEYPSGKNDYLDHWLDKNICIANVTTGIGMSTGFAFAEDVISKLY